MTTDLSFVPGWAGALGGWALLIAFCTVPLWGRAREAWADEGASALLDVQPAVGAVYGWGLSGGSVAGAVGGCLLAWLLATRLREYL